jgi:signal transduction histidine kinase
MEGRENEEATHGSGSYHLARAAAFISILFGAIILAGWSFNLLNVQRVWPGMPRIPPNGALISLLLGVALASKTTASKFSRAAGGVAALIAAAIGLVTLLEYLLGWTTGLDQWLFAKQFAGSKAAWPGRLSFPAALSVFCLGVGIALIDLRIRRVYVAQLFAVIVLMTGVLALIGHLCNVPEFYGQMSNKPRSGTPLQATLGLLLLGTGLLCARPDRGLVAILWSYTPGGMLARWLLLAPAVGLLLTGVVYIVFTRISPVEHSVRTWALGWANMFFVVVPICAAAHALHKVGLERDRAHDELEDRVRQRTAELSSANVALQAEIKERAQAEAALREARDRLETQALELEGRVQERTAKLAESVGDLEAFAYSVAHDMRAPLRGMQGFAHLLLAEHAGSLQGDARDYLERIAHSAERMDALIQDALSYTQVLRSETELHPVDLDKALRQLISTFPGWQEPNADVQIRGILPHAVAHEGFIVQCFANLIGNAVKFVAPGTMPRVRIWAEERDRRVRVYVEDNGIGIASKDHDRVFRMFERLNSADEYEGTAIGLAIVRKAVERMHGRVDYESTPGRGTRFWIDLRCVVESSGALGREPQRHGI